MNNGLIDKLLSYADRPWRVVAVIVLGLAAGTGYALWEQRATIAAAILEKTVIPQLEPQRFPDIAQRLMDGTKADVVLLSRVSIPANLITNVDGRLATDPTWRPRPDARAIFGDQISLTQVLDAVEGRVICEDVPTTDGHRVLIALGMTRRCWVSIPPIPDILVGAVTLGWKTAQPADLEAGARSKLRQEAMKLATW